MLREPNRTGGLTWTDAGNIAAAVAVRRCPPSGWIAPADLVQDTMIALIEAGARTETGTALHPAVVSTIAHRTMIDTLRRARLAGRDGNRPAPTPLSLDRPAGDGPSPVVGRWLAVAPRDRAAWLDLTAGLGRLPERDRTVLLALALEIPLGAIGAWYGVSGARICQIAARARATLRAEA